MINDVQVQVQKVQKEEKDKKERLRILVQLQTTRWVATQVATLSPHPTRGVAGLICCPDPWLGPARGPRRERQKIWACPEILLP